MASATVDSTSIVTSATADDVPLQADSIPIVDIRLLSQSELYSLSQCSSSAVGPLRCDDVAVPKIDRSVFNESAGSRKQTYSRYRLAPASSSSSAASSAPRRRTPHFRPTAVTNCNNGNSVPEKEENPQIIALLKQLFVSNSNPEDVVPVKIDYNYSLPQQLSSFPSSSSSNVVPVNHKRKRGRPCQLEMVKNDANSTLVVNANVDSYDGNNNKSGSIMSENFGDVDRDRKALLNRDGVKVDLVALGTVENPYAEEIKQRTEGLNGKEDLVRFLEGLDGKWGSSRKKRRIVDASVFGSVLPIGWKLLLSLKKKKGHVWLYCSRYQSPSGRQFVSCKDISSYLLSLHCVRDMNKVNCAENNQSINDSNSLSSVSIANVKKQDDKRKKNPIFRASLVVSSTSSNHEMQVTLDAGDQPEDKVGKFLHCDECKMTFSEKDDLLHHQSSLHREKMCKNDLPLNDVVIVKEGNYEHLFTCNTFNEVNNLNDHIGAHERNHVKSTEESLSVDVGVCVDPSSFCQQPVREVMLKGSLGSIGNNMGETSKVYEFPLSNNENKNFKGGSVRAHIPDSVAGISGDGCNVQGKCSPVHSSFPFTETVAGVSKEIKNSVTLEDSKQDRVFETGLFGSDDKVKACDIVVNDEHFCQSMNELKRDAEKFVDDDSVFGFRSRPVGQENYSAIRVKQHGNFEVLSFENVGNVPIPSISTETWSNQIKESRRNMLTAHGDQEEVKEIAPSSVGEYPLDGKFSFGTSGNANYEADKDALSSIQEEMQFGISSVPSWYEQASFKNYGNEEATSLGKEAGVQNTHEGSLLTLSDHERITGTEHLEDKVCSRKMEMLEVDGVQNVRTSELFLSHSGRDRDGPRGNQIGNSGNEFIIGFGRNNLRPVEGVMAAGIWTAGQQNVLHGTATTSPQVQPSSSFHASHIMSDQDAQGLIEVQEKYNINANVEGISSGRSEPVEYSFLGSNSSNVIPMESNVFSHNSNMEQGLDSSFWLGNNALMPNTEENRSKSSSVCVWCRNVFYHETNQHEMEAAGAIGSMCPTCSTRIPGNFNVL
ncbi:uncharacterized protein LOC111401396 [Olea europaea var. sylvestris]|uniref:uncharacterized protein LOC111401396 n=1 Tax=Olea europaea var. sylvestris TaxID=158386 RepID=UPI000C1D45D4|nr:uncharacterized protein LOC111401396 [Olea europaea var. sylvestris]